jgi:hypothetical protein
MNLPNVPPQDTPPTSEAPALPEYQLRVLVEYADLQEKVNRLTSFTHRNNPMWQAVPLEEKFRMVRQLEGMNIYLHALRDRRLAIAREYIHVNGTSAWHSLLSTL